MTYQILQLANDLFDKIYKLKKHLENIELTNDEEKRILHLDSNVLKPEFMHEAQSLFMDKYREALKMEIKKLEEEFEKL